MNPIRWLTPIADRRQRDARSLPDSRRIDRALENSPFPPIFRDTRSLFVPKSTKTVFVFLPG
ncbi:MAG TPA: hypothetical protein PKN13_11560 [Accumulibacter sp.]|nr:hypothetical protein [Accumulibacter sp.]HMW17868.1 hypothetical protein [Accumulibacter sp.]HNC17959.1 hypothetical protein [Accumulibacter sp.]HND80343.1 hypothetical protein [Accumulibacter sp.]HNE13119.1 hypothetical protein [Accumulibacter sp.]